MISICLCANVIQSQNTSQNHSSVSESTQSTKLPQTGENDEIQLQQVNEDMQQQISNLEKEVDRYRKDVMAKEKQINKNISHWLVILSIMITLVGVVIPLLLNAKTERFFKRKVDEVKDLTKITSEQARYLEEEMERYIEILRSAEGECAKTDALSENDNETDILIKAKSEENHRKAIELFNRVIELFPASADALKERGARKHRIKDDEGAIRDFEKAIQINPNDAEAYYMLAQLYLAQNRLHEALESINQAIRFNSQEFEFYDTRSEIHISMDKYSDAIDDLNKAILLNDKSVRLHMMRSKCYQKLADLEQDEEKKAHYLTKAKDDEHKANTI